MKQIEGLLAIAEIFCERSGRSRARVSTIIFNDGKGLKRLSDGGDLGTKTFARAMEWFSANWPEGADWPKDVHRPICDAPPSQAVLSHADGLATSPAPPPVQEPAE